MDGKPRSVAKVVRTAILGLGMVGGLGAVGAGCLTRPVTSSAPSLKTNVTIDVRNQSIDKVDLLFAVDNSASMGDKQEFFAQAVPKLVGRLVNPYCTDANGSTTDSAGNLYGSSNFGDCSTVTAAGANSKPEFPPVHNMHIGIVSTSIGALGANTCPESGNGSQNPVNTQLSAHNNDRAHLLVRGDPAFNAASPQEVIVNDAANGASVQGATCDTSGGGTDFTSCSPGFLAWYPSVAANPPGGAPAIPITDQNKLISDFQEMMQGVHEYGCGLESMLESWYRFLIQPDPYDNIPPQQGGRTSLQGVDATILQQRHDFLRPDSLVAIILLTDENDSEMDPQWYGDQGWAFNNLTFPGSSSAGGGAPKGTSVCQNTPSDPSCVGASCAFCTAATQADPNCGGACTGNPPAPPASAYWTGQEDNVNLRHVHMRQKYGVDPQYPISRYVRGLTSPKVPNRGCEHNNNCQDGTQDAQGNYVNWKGSSLYVGDNNAICTNPLFAASLSTSTKDDPNSPTSSYCTLPTGSRTPDLIFFAAITGVPSPLLHFVPNDPNKSKLVDSDWVAILGQGPAGDPNQAGLTDVLSGIDPHMIESNVPRGNGIPGPNALCNPSNGTCTDTVVGSDWDSKLQDLMFACTFPFSNGLVKDCTSPQYANACDCEGGNLPPLCDPNTPTKQNRAKAYPGIRQLALVRALKDQGIAASICPQEVNDQTSPVYGYNPAVEAIVDRLKTQLANQCLPQPLQVDSQGNVPCLILAVLGTQGPESSCTQFPGLSAPDPQVLAKFLADEEAAYNAPGGGKSLNQPDPSTFPVCEVKEIPGIPPGQTCLGNATPGWCYVVNTTPGQTGPAGACPQAIIFSQSSIPPTGSTTHLECIENSNTGADGGT